MAPRFSIVWPTPGYPALLEGGRHFSILVSHPSGGSVGLEHWARGLGLRELGGRRTIAVLLVEIKPADPASLGSIVEGLAGLPHLRGLGFARVRLAAPAPLGPAGARRVQLYDLVVGDRVARSRCVAAWNATHDRLRVAFASDIHWSVLWDCVADAATRHAPDLLPRMVHPRQMLGRLIDAANHLAARGELDLVVLGGDLVEHVHPAPERPGRQEESHVGQLVGALTALSVPTIAVAGNHDWRLYPWRPRLYGLRAIGIPDGRVKPLLRAAGLWDPWPVRLSDFAALRTRAAGDSAGLAAHRSLVAPALDFALTLHKTRLVFASTGCDILPRSCHVEGRRLGLFCRGLRHIWRDPDSEGFRDRQVAWIAQALTGAHGAAVFFHAPLMRIPTAWGAGRHIGCFPPGAPECRKSQVEFERRLSRCDLRRGVAFRNPGAVLHAMAAAGCPVVAFSGHVHQTSAIAVDRHSWSFRTAGLSADEWSPDDVTLVTAPAVAQLRSEQPEPPGYLLAEFVDGRLARLEKRELRVGI